MNLSAFIEVSQDGEKCRMFNNSWEHFILSGSENSHSRSESQNYPSMSATPAIGYDPIETKDAVGSSPSIGPAAVASASEAITATPEVSE